MSPGDGGFECNGQWVLKKSLIGMYSGLRFIAAIEFSLSPQLSGSFRTEWCWLAEEPRQSLDVLGRGCQKELLAHEL